MRIIAADVGNSSVKFAKGATSDDRDWHADCQVALSHENLKRLHLEPECSSFQQQLVDCGIDGPHAWFVSSVNQRHQQILKKLATDHGLVDSWHVIDRNQVGIEIDLIHPNQVGTDRLLAALAASRMSRPRRDTIVVDCGTALTVDLIDRNSVFRGGVIMAGPSTNLMALGTMTAALPNLSQSRLVKPASVVGRSTEQAMLSGAWHSGWGAIQQVVVAMQQACHDQACVIGTGGGLGPWESVLPSDWMIIDDLVLAGILHVARQLVGDTSVTGMDHE